MTERQFEIDSGWLLEVIRDADGLADDATVAGLTVRRIGETTGLIGTILRFEIVVRSNGSTKRVRGVLKRPPEPGSHVHALTSKMGFHRSEVRFYEEIAPLLPAGAVPRSMAGGADEDDDGFLVLEDLSVAEPHPLNVAVPPARTRSALRFLADLHATCWQQPGQPDSSWPTHFARPDTAEFIDQLYGEALPVAEEAIAAHLAETHGLGAQAATVVDSYRTLRPRLPQLLDVLRSQALPTTTVHGDFYPHNCLFGPTGEGEESLHVVDFQTVSRGCCLLDVAFFLSLGLATDERRGEEANWLREYHGMLTAADRVDYPIDDLLHHYRACRLWSVVQAIASVHVFESSWVQHREPRDRFAALLIDAVDDGLLHDLAFGRLI